MFFMVVMLFVLVFGVLIVGLGFRNEILEMMENVVGYDLVMNNFWVED